MKLFKAMLILICFSATAFSLDMPSPLYDMNGRLRKLGLITNIQDIFVKLGERMDKSSTENVGGNKTFTGTDTFTQPLIAQSSMTVYGSINTQGKHWEMIQSSTTYVAATSFSFTGLNGNIDTQYKIVMKLKCGSAAATVFYIRPNADGGGNYGRQFLAGTNTTASAGRATANTGIICGYSTAVGNESFTTCLLKAKSGYYRYAILNIIQDVAATTIGNCLLDTGVWANSADNITSLQIIADQAGGIGVGSDFQLWTLR